MINYEVKRIKSKECKEYIIQHHYTHGCSNSPSACYGLFDNDTLIGACVFACPCSENVRSSVFGVELKDSVTELHRLFVIDGTPKNTESWFISKCLKLLVEDKPIIKAVISFADPMQGHKGIIYQATNAYYCGKSGKATFYLDDKGKLHHPRKSGRNISKAEAAEKGWKPVKCEGKHRYLYILGSDKKEHRKLLKLCKLTLSKNYENINELLRE